MATTLNNSNSMTDFDWEAYANKTEDRKYDEPLVYNQGIAIVKKWGKFGAIMVGGKEIVPPIYDSLSDFKDGYAVAVWNGEERIVNLSGQIKVLNNGKEIFLPEDYDWGVDYVNDICIVVKNKKFGCIDNYFSIVVTPEYRSIVYETNKYLRVLKDSLYGILNNNGNVIIPVKFNNIKKILNDNGLFWIVKKDNVQGVYNEKGSLIIPVIYNNIECIDNVFSCEIYKRYYSYSSYNENDSKISMYYNSKGEQIVKIDEKTVFKTPCVYDIAYYANLGFIRVMKGGKWGIIDRIDNVVLEPQFTFIDTFNNSFAKVGKTEEDITIYLLNENLYSKRLKYGLIDTLGNIVLPLEYDQIEKWDNDYYLVQKDGLYGILSPSLQIVIEVNKKSCKKLDDRFIIIGESTWCGMRYGLIDFYGNVIIPNKSFIEIEVIEHNFLKVIYSECDYTGRRYMAVLNNQGNSIYRNDACMDILYIGNGLFKVIDIDNNYNLVNYQGKEIFDTFYKELKFGPNGDIHIKGYKGWGMANDKGHIIVSPKYLNELKYENGYSEIEVKYCKNRQKIDLNGNLIVTDSNHKEVIIPKDYYWASNYVKGLSLVRSKKNDKIGVIDVKGQIIIHAKYDRIYLLSDNTLLVKEKDCYGLYDLLGKCIFPPIFTSIKYLHNNKRFVVWNLKFATQWEKGTYFIENESSKYKEIGSKYEVNNRSALCDFKGNKLNDSQFLYIGKFNNEYALSYSKIEIENNRTRLKRVGVIDINGNTIVSPDYDEIVLYSHSFALLKKNFKYGIVNLKTRKIILFDDIDIKRTWKMDVYGRFVYTEDGIYDSKTKRWTGNRGVASIHGIIIPTGKYKKIELLENGLIKVSNENNSLFGLLNSEGKELLPMKYSYISKFEGEYASICLGGHNEDNYPYNHTGGKWGIIDRQGLFFSECVKDNKQELPKQEVVIKNVENLHANIVPSVLLSDVAPKSNNDYYNTDNYYTDDDDDQHSQYGGYNGYDDNTINSAFEGEPELTWNID